MFVRLRQVCLVAPDLRAVEEAVCGVFGLEACVRDRGVHQFGLRNVLFPVGNGFLEIAAPKEKGTAAGRFLKRHNGAGGYMVILQTDSQEVFRARARAARVRTALEFEDAAWGYKCWQMHPQDTGACFLEIDEERDVAADGAWHPAGRGWESHRRTGIVSGMLGVELEGEDCGALSAKWGAVLEGAGYEGGDIVLENAALRFVEAEAGSGAGLAGVDLAVVDKARLLAAAARRGLRTGEDEVTLCGTRFYIKAAQS